MIIHKSVKVKERQRLMKQEVINIMRLEPGGKYNLDAPYGSRRIICGGAWEKKPAMFILNRCTDSNSAFSMFLLQYYVCLEVSSAGEVTSQQAVASP